MGTGPAIGIASLVLLCGSSLALASTLLSPNKALVYEYEGGIQAQADYPSPAASSFTLRGLLTIQVDAAGKSANFKLSELSSTLYNGANLPSDQPRSEFYSLPDQGGELSKQFTVHYSDESPSVLSGVDGEAEWAVNMKRSLASLLQLDTSKLNRTTFIAKESGLYGTCTVSHVVVRDGSDFLVRKFLDHTSTCTSYASATWSNVPSVEPFCPSGQDHIITSTGERNYRIQQLADGYRVVKMEASGSVLAQPFKARQDLQTIVTRQALVFRSSSDLVSPASPLPGNQRDLTFVLPGRDFTQGRAPVKQATAVTQVKRLLTEIADSVDASIELDADKLHDERVPHVIYYLTLLENKALEELFSEYSVGTSYQYETIRNLFFDLLPQIGTTDSILFVRNLVVSRRVKRSTSEQLLRDLPFYVRRPSEALLRDCEAFYALDDTPSVRAAGVLSFATLFYKTCGGSGCEDQTKDRYVRKYLDLFTGAENYREKMMYLEGLSNMEEGKVFEYLEPIIRSNPDRHLRFLAVWATMNKAMFHPNEMFDLYWPILSDRTSLLEMRVAALTMLVVSNPSAGRFFSLHWFMSTEPEPRLKHFYYTTLQSLVNTRDPCYSMMSTNAAQVLRLLPPPSQRHWSTGNYILDHGNTELGFGGMAQLFLIANHKSELPNVFYLMLGSHAVGKRFNQFSIYLKLEGIANAVKQRLLRIDPNQVNIPQLADILRKMKAAPSSAEPVHFELLVKRDGRVTICEHLNGTTFHHLADVIGRLLKVSQQTHVNFQSINTPVLHEMTIPTDMGTPALYLLSATSVVSFRGNLSLEAAANGFSLSKETELRVASTATANLMAYNPVTDLWQAVQRSTTLRFILPFDGRLALDKTRRSLDFGFTKRSDAYTGLVTHVRSVVLVRGTGAAKRLRSHCPKCDALVTVSRGDKYRRKNEFLDLEVSEVGVQLKGELFDCEHHNGFHALNAAVRTQNYQVFPASRPLVITAHLLSCWLLVAPPGSCGTQLKLATVNQQPATLEGQILLTGSDSRPSGSLRLAHKAGSTTLHSWQLDAVCQHDNTFYNVTLNVVRNAPTEDMRKLCMSATINIPAYPSDKYLVRASDPITADATFSWGSVAGVCDAAADNVLPLRLSFVAETTVEQATVAGEAKTWPFSACKAGNDPAACHVAAHEMATLRKYSVAVNYSEPLEPALFILARGPDGQLVASIEVPFERPVALISVGEDQFTFDTGRYWIEPFLVNTHYPALHQAAMAFGLIKPDVK